MEEEAAAAVRLSFCCCSTTLATFWYPHLSFLWSAQGKGASLRLGNVVSKPLQLQHLASVPFAETPLPKNRVDSPKKRLLPPPPPIPPLSVFHSMGIVVRCWHRPPRVYRIGDRSARRNDGFERPRGRGDGSFDRPRRDGERRTLPPRKPELIPNLPQFLLSIAEEILPFRIAHYALCRPCARQCGHFACDFFEHTDCLPVCDGPCMLNFRPCYLLYCAQTTASCASLCRQSIPFYCCYVTCCCHLLLHRQATMSGRASAAVQTGAERRVVEVFS